MITQQDFEQIQDAIAGKLSADEQQAYNKRLSTDSNFAEDAFLQDKLKNILSDKPFDEFRGTLMRIETEYHYLGLWRTTETTETFSIEDILAMFEPVAHYEQALSHADLRAAGTALLQPQNGSNFLPNDSLTFVWAAALTEPLVLSIENNQEDVVLQDTIETGTVSHNITLPNLPAGRYYFKLTGNNSGMYIGMFFVNKNLLDEL